MGSKSAHQRILLIVLATLTASCGASLTSSEPTRGSIAFDEATVASAAAAYLRMITESNHTLEPIRLEFRDAGTDAAKLKIAYTHLSAWREDRQNRLQAIAFPGPVKDSVHALLVASQAVDELDRELVADPLNSSLVNEEKAAASVEQAAAADMRLALNLPAINVEVTPVPSPT